MAKKDTIIALRNRGIEESIAWMLVDAGFTISQLKRSKIGHLTKYLSEESAKSVLNKMGVKVEESDKKKATIQKGKKSKVDTPKKKTKEKKDTKEDVEQARSTEQEEPETELLWYEPNGQRITKYRKLLNRDPQAIFPTRCQFKTSRPKFPVTGYISIPEKGIAYSCKINSMRTTMEPSPPKSNEVVVQGEERKRFSTFLSLSDFERFKHPIPLNRITTIKGEGIKKVKEFIKITSPFKEPTPQEPDVVTQVVEPSLPPLPPKGVKPRVGIIWSVQEEDLVALYKKTLDDKKIVLWGVTFPVNPKKFKYPLTGYIYMKGEGVRYLAKIDDVEAAPEPFVASDNKLLPPTLSGKEFPTYFKISSIVPLDRVYALSEFRNTSGDPVRSARNYTQIMDLPLTGTMAPEGYEEEVLEGEGVEVEPDKLRTYELVTIRDKIEEVLKESKEKLPEPMVVRLGVFLVDRFKDEEQLKNAINLYCRIEKVTDSLEIHIPESLKDKLVTKLIKLNPTTPQLKRLLKRISERFTKNTIDPHESAGIIAAQSIGEPGTQMTMRTFHYAGVAEINVTLGLPRLIEIVDARRVPSTPMMEIHIEDKIRNNLEAVKRLASTIEITKLYSIAKIETDLVNLKIVISADMKECAKRDISIEDIAKKLTRIRGSVEVFDEQIHINMAEASYKSLQETVSQIKDIKIKGIDGIHRAIIRKEEKGYVLYTEGSNLTKVLMLDGVDISNTSTNAIMEIYEVLGIEAARNAIITEASKTLSEQGLTVDLRHIMLVADVMTNDGEIEAIGRHGISGRKSSVLARAAFEITSTHLLHAGITGESDNLAGVAENIIVGQPVTLGTGAVNLVYKPPEKNLKK